MLSRRLLLAMAGLLALYAIAFTLFNQRTIRTYRELLFEARIAALQSSGALKLCDDAPEAWGVPDSGLGGFYAVRSDGTLPNPQAPVDTISLPADQPSLEGISVPELAWAAIATLDREGPCAHLLVYEQRWLGFSDSFMLRFTLTRLAIGPVLAFAIWWLIVRPLINRIQRMAADTERIASAGFIGQLEVGATRDELDELADSFNVAAAAARERLLSLESQARATREVMGNLAHDMRIPLSTLQLCIERSDPASMSLAVGELSYLDALLSNIQLMVKLESEQWHMTRFPFDLEQTIERIEGRFTLLATRRGIALHSAIHSAVPEFSGDPIALEQAIGNLVHNALKFARANAALICRMNEAHIVIEVSDDGPGPQTTELPQLSDRYFRGAGSRTRGLPGHGLGLAITAAIIQRHHGVFSLTREGEVTVARIMLPIAGRKDCATTAQ